jgi:hypothetical protein
VANSRWAQIFDLRFYFILLIILFIIVLQEIPEDQQELDDERETLVPVCHFHQKPDNLHGQPYLVRLVKGEPLDKTRDRIRKAGGFSEANFSKWRLCVVADGHSKYLDDDSASGMLCI